MKNYKLLLYLLIIYLLAGCTVFPVNRTYFEPNPEDGILTKSSSCGYNATSMDTLEREINGLLFSVSPSYKEGKMLHVSILIKIQSGIIEIHPDQFELHNMSDNSILKPVNISRNSYGPDKSHPYINNWVQLDFPIVSEKLEEITFVFPKNTIKHNGEIITLKSFRFKKTTKSDVYYGSVNC